ncbi:ATP synthase subunit I [Comamonadaceae bacterium OH2310_COT-174]|nr:ATP synthase subunit I [Comamonadaceae bacterium OH2310_COT-174]
MVDGQQPPARAQIGKGSVWDAQELGEDEQTPPLDAEQAAQWRQRHRSISPWKVLLWQGLAALLGGGALWLVLQESVAIISWFYGYLAIALPAALYAKVVVSQPGLTALVAHEMLKLLLTVVLMALAPVVLGKVNWLALLLAVVLSVNMYWIAPVWMARSGGIRND